MLGLMPVIELLMLGKVFTGHPRMVINMPMLEVGVLGYVALPD
jgi:hypothetical protein